MSEARIAFSRVQLRDSFVMRETADIFVSHLTQFANMAPDRAEAEAEAHFVSVEQAYGYAPTQREERKPFVYQDGFAIIPVHGALLNRFGGAYSFATGYNYIRRVMNAALEDDDVKVIVLDVDSPGGEAAGCFELAAEIREAREKKPIVAVVDALSASAGYAIPSAATKIYATPSSKVGSIGVVRMHMNMAGMLEKMGVEVTLIEAPEDGMKTAGNSFEKLSEEAKKDFQNSVNRAYDDFVALIVANRGMDDAEVRATRAKVYRADEALALRLIDAVKTPTEAVAAFVAELASEDEPEHEEDDPMAEATSTAPTADQLAAAVTADRERMTAIKALPEAAERPKLADTLALGGYSVEQATTLLKAAAVETPPAAAPAAPAAPGAEAGKTGTEGTSKVDEVNHLDAAMGGVKHPNVGAGGGEKGGGGGGAEPTSEELTAAILKDQAGVTGVNFGEKSKTA